MKTDCINFDECTEKELSSCCASYTRNTDICASCGEHCDSYCTDCQDYDNGEEKEPTEDDIKRSKEEHEDRRVIAKYWNR
jgi:hypothetical protein